MQTKLFVGTRLTPELKIRITEAALSLCIIPYEGKEYLGAYLEPAHPTVQQIRSFCDQFLLTLQKQCPDQRVDTLPVVVFPQLFVG